MKAKSKEVKLAEHLQLIQLFKIFSHHVCHLGVRDFVCSPGTCSIDLDLDKHTVVYITLNQIRLNQYKLSVYARIYSVEQNKFLRNKRLSSLCTKVISSTDMAAHVRKLPKLLISFLHPKPNLQIVSRRVV